MKLPLPDLTRSSAAALVGIVLAASSASASAGLRVDGMTFVGSRGKQSELVVRATTALFHPDTGLANLEQVHATMSDAEEGESFQMECDQAELNVETNDFTATGNVTGLTGDGQRYSAPWVRYEHERALLLTDAPVRVVDSGGTFRGDGFRYYIDERRFELLGNVTVEQGP